jgi:hypothetical protein
METNIVKLNSVFKRTAASEDEGVMARPARKLRPSAMVVRHAELRLKHRSSVRYFSYSVTYHRNIISLKKYRFNSN